MPIIKDENYRPQWFLRNGHLATFYPYFFRKLPQIRFQRKRIHTPDNDFLDLDILKQNNTKAAFLCHGLEGDSSSQYIQGMSQLLQQKGFDIIALNYRGCSGEMNRKVQAYHSGATEDLHTALNATIPDYKEVHLIGFSLGGNLVLKYMGEGKWPIFENIQTVTAISVPCDLSKAAKVLERRENILYTWRFLFSLKAKLKAKARIFPKQIDMRNWKQIRTLRDFDNYYTGPLHGFKDAEDYYAKSSCLPILSSINIPALIINAADDPFLHPSSFPTEIASYSDKLHLLIPDYGGHVGFYNGGHTKYYSEQKAMEFILKHSKSMYSSG